MALNSKRCAIACARATRLTLKSEGQARRPPRAGSPRHAHELNLPGLRAWPLTRYPHLVFYVERPDHVDVWRVHHGQRDIPVWMQGPEVTI
jgi:toxin ParE1/3/4